MKKRVRDQRGFTIIEAALAMVVMSVVGLGAASLFAFAVKYNSGANHRAVAIAIAQQRIETLRSASFSDTSLDATSAQGTYEYPYPHVGDQPYAVKKTVTDVTPTLKTISIEVAPAGADTWENTAVTLTTRRASTSTGDYLK